MKTKTTVLQWAIAAAALGVAQFGAFGQDEATTRRVTGQENAQGSQVIINQIDTSAFPKVTIFATVLKDGKPLRGLGAKDFKVREDEVEQEPLTVVPKLTPLSAVVTLDTSGSMKKRLADAKTAAKSFIDELPADDKVQLIGFSREVRLLSQMGADRGAIKDAVDATAARGDTALYDALYASVQALKDKAGRKAIILLSDGADDDGTGKQMSKHSLDEALALAREVNVPIFAIGIGEIDETVLKKAASQTGGMFLLASQPGELQKLYDKIGAQLEGQYNIYYASDLPGDGSMHRVRLDYDKASAFKEYKSPTVVARAPAPKPMPVRAAAQPPPASGPLTNIAEAKNGGRVVDFTSEYDKTSVAVKNLIDGGKASWSGKNANPQAVVIGFKDDQIAEIEDIVVNPYGTGNRGDWAKDVEFYASETYPWKGFTLLGKLTLKHEGSDQTFSLPAPIKARYVKVLFRTNYRGGYMYASEIQVIGRLKGEGDKPEPLTNWASKAKGASVEKSTSEYDSSDYAAANLIDGEGGVGEVWSGKTDGAQEVVIKLPDTKEITDIAVNTYGTSNAGNSATQVEVFTSPEYAHKGFQSHGKIETPLDGDFHVVSLPSPVNAKFVKVVFLKNGGGGYMYAGEIRAYGK